MHSLIPTPDLQEGNLRPLREVVEVEEGEEAKAEAVGWMVEQIVQSKQVQITQNFVNCLSSARVILQRKKQRKRIP
jgi:hypothetical protein